MLGLGTRNKKAPQRGCFCYAVWAGRDVLKSDVLHLQCFFHGLNKHQPVRRHSTAGVSNSNSLTFSQTYPLPV